MTIVVCDNGETRALEYLVNKGAPENLRVRLYTNNKSPAETDNAASFNEATFSGYAAAALAGANWTVAPGAPSVAAYPEQTFMSNASQASQLCYGYFMTRETTGDLILAERFSDGPYTIQNNGDSIRLTPRIEAT